MIYNKLNDLKFYKKNHGFFYGVALFIFNWVGFAALMLFLGLMILDGAILAARLIKVIL
jgi:hypothetical protein